MTMLDELVAVLDVQEVLKQYPYATVAKINKAPYTAGIFSTATFGTMIGSGPTVASAWKNAADNLNTSKEC